VDVEVILDGLGYEVAATQPNLLVVDTEEAADAAIRCALNLGHVARALTPEEPLPEDSYVCRSRVSKKYFLLGVKRDGNGSWGPKDPRKSYVAPLAWWKKVMTEVWQNQDFIANAELVPLDAALAESQPRKEQA
jgi:hypothetical protein